jgi:hypothetical protein
MSLPGCKAGVLPVLGHPRTDQRQPDAKPCHETIVSAIQRQVLRRLPDACKCPKSKKNPRGPARVWGASARASQSVPPVTASMRCSARLTQAQLNLPATASRRPAVRGSPPQPQSCAGRRSSSLAAPLGPGKRPCSTDQPACQRRTKTHKDTADNFL